jgi:hypothetical protein
MTGQGHLKRPWGIWGYHHVKKEAKIKGVEEGRWRRRERREGGREGGGRGRKGGREEGREGGREEGRDLFYREELGPSASR